MIYHMSTAQLPRLTPPVPLRHHVARSIREAILRGDMKPGQRLVERKMAAELGVSQIAVREGLTELEHEGLLTRTPNVGAHVTKLSPAKLGELLAVRLMLEPPAMALASRKLTPAAIQKLQSLVDQYNRYASAGDAYQTVRTDFSFHQAVWNLAENETLARMLTQVCTSTFAFVMILLSQRHSTLVEPVDVHQTFLNCLVEGDPDRIQRIVREQLQEAWAPYVTGGE
jgi:DNA-binding GntR family transcriptional regulator